MPLEPVIFAKFIAKDILAEMGRLLFTLLNVFSLNGYHIKLFHNMDFEKLEKEKGDRLTIYKVGKAGSETS